MHAFFFPFERVIFKNIFYSKITVELFYDSTKFEINSFEWDNFIFSSYQFCKKLFRGHPYFLILNFVTLFITFTKFYLFTKNSGNLTEKVIKNSVVGVTYNLDENNFHGMWRLKNFCWK